MGEIAQRVAEGADKIVRKVALAVDRNVVLSTPVDTGRARANWIPSLDVSSDSTTTSKDKTGSKAIAEASGVIREYDGDKNVSINIANNLPYIERLNEGSSAQAPAGFVRIAVDKGIATAEASDPLEE